MIPSSFLKYYQPAMWKLEMYGIRPEGLKYSTQTLRKISLFQPMQRTPVAEVVQEKCHALQFVHDQRPIVIVSLPHLST
jgi:hypothetical protein